MLDSVCVCSVKRANFIPCTIVLYVMYNPQPRRNRLGVNSGNAAGATTASGIKFTLLPPPTPLVIPAIARTSPATVSHETRMNTIATDDSKTPIDTAVIPAKLTPAVPFPTASPAIHETISGQQMQSSPLVMTENNRDTTFAVVPMNTKATYNDSHHIPSNTKSGDAPRKPSYMTIARFASSYASLGFLLLHLASCAWHMLSTFIMTPIMIVQALSRFFLLRLVAFSLILNKDNHHKKQYRLGLIWLASASQLDMAMAIMFVCFYCRMFWPITSMLIVSIVIVVFLVLRDIPAITPKPALFPPLSSKEAESHTTPYREVSHQGILGVVAALNILGCVLFGWYESFGGMFFLWMMDVALISITWLVTQSKVLGKPVPSLRLPSFCWPHPNTKAWYSINAIDATLRIRLGHDMNVKEEDSMLGLKGLLTICVTRPMAFCAYHTTLYALGCTLRYWSDKLSALVSSILPSVISGLSDGGTLVLSPQLWPTFAFSDALNHTGQLDILIDAEKIINEIVKHDTLPPQQQPPSSNDTNTNRRRLSHEEVPSHQQQRPRSIHDMPRHERPASAANTRAQNNYRIMGITSSK